MKTSRNVVFLKTFPPHLRVSLVPGEEAGGAEQAEEEEPPVPGRTVGSGTVGVKMIQNVVFEKKIFRSPVGQPCAR